jgi:EAL domain-containing protein (putative c-di-GMP-specific phosphodiesterase class I)
MRELKALSKGKDGYDILEESRGKEEIKKNEMKVKKIIEQNDFDISFVFDSYSFGGELLMRELKPNLKDDNNIFPIGLFVAVSEKLDLNRKFDTEVILKAIDFIKNNKIDYKIAINLSIKTVSNPDFIIFLEDLVSKNEDFVKHIVFSITSYSASAYKNIFIDFVAHLNRIGIEILIKRYKTKELSLDELANIRINYIKIDKELTQNIHNDVIKKHKIKNIIIFAEINDIKVLVENIESDRDYLYLNKLDLYAVNR